MSRTAITAHQIAAALGVRFAPPAWALMEEVANSTGYAGRGYTDAVAVSLWPSRGLEIHGIEVKVSRGDWRAELARPEKNALVQGYCDRFWLAAPAGVVDGDLPATWGHLLAAPYGDGARLTCAVEAPKLDPQPLDRAFVAAVLRRAHEREERAARLAANPSDVARSDGYKEGHAAGLADAAKGNDLANLREAVARFEKASGIEIGQPWDAGHVGEVARVLVQPGGVGRLADLSRQLDSAARAVADALRTWNGAA